ncbi:hypothetical protein HPB50_018728 [Hyalomma asiaticum]|uniref:Uncharacterized protein n=1 Tax=Hyalomma asiaticum TaxID=266040 RepID=A0ACB7RVH9_HYAAI|nr:hypothetical protein HPB50_018728 [Hyalomma asiaticum]
MPCAASMQCAGSRKIHVVSDLPVGHNLQDHLFLLGTCATTTKNVQVWPQSVPPVTQYALFRTGPFALPAGIEATAFMNTSYGSREYPDFQAHLLSISGASVEGERFIKDLGVRQDIYDAYFKPKRGSNAFHIGVALNRLKSRGFIKLRSRRYTDSPILDPRYYTHPDDVKMAAEAMGQAIRLMKTKAFAALGTKPWDVHFPPCKSHPIWSNEYMQCLARYLSPTSWHPCCTNPMGSGKRAVVDPRLSVRFGPFTRLGPPQGKRAGVNTVCSLAATIGVFLVWAYLEIVQSLSASSRGHTDRYRFPRRLRVEIENLCRCAHANDTVVSQLDTAKGGHICVCYDESDLFATEAGDLPSPYNVSSMVSTGNAPQENASEHGVTQLLGNGSANA